MKQTNIKNLVIGFGKAGKTLAKTLASKGEEVILVEQSKTMYGGTCINVGCIPSKKLLNLSTQGLDFEKAMQAKNDLISKLNTKNYKMIADESKARVVDGTAVFRSNYQVDILDETGTAIEHITAERIFINTGATPVIPNIKGISESKNIITSTEALNLASKPSSITIIGAGYIGLEMATMLNNFGIKINVIDTSTAFLPREDKDIADKILNDMMSVGINICIGCTINEIKDTSTAVELKFTTREGKDLSLQSDKILVCTGRKPNIDSLGIHNTGIAIDSRGAITVDEHLQTKVPNIYALGDVHGGLQFTYTSLDDFRIVLDHLYGTKTKKLSDRTTVPYSVFLTPPLSSVGINETTAKQKNIPYNLFSLECSNIPNAHILGQTKGILKVLTHPETNTILGAVLYSANSFELINTISLAINQGIPYTVLRDAIYTHPTMNESFNDLFKAAVKK